MFVWALRCRHEGKSRQRWSRNHPHRQHKTVLMPQSRYRYCFVHDYYNTPLHHYDAIGLLKPSRVGDNGYRYYGEESVLRLQQILFYRELGIPLENIKKIMGRRDFDVLGALRSHKEALKKQVSRINRLIQTVDNTINHLKGNTSMSEKVILKVSMKKSRKNTHRRQSNYMVPRAYASLTANGRLIRLQRRKQLWQKAKQYTRI